MDWSPFANSAPALLSTAAAAATAVASYGMFHPRSRLFGPVITRGPRDSSKVALTFDDGPWPGSTELILDTLATHRIKATFFVIGRYAKAHPDIIKRAADEGHLIGNHSFDHRRLGMFRHTAYWNQQIAQTQEVIAEITGSLPEFFRPPMGFKSPYLMSAVRRNNVRAVTWSWRGFDSRAISPDRICSASGSIQSGDIAMLHDGRDPASRKPIGATARALEGVIEGLVTRGLGFERLDAFVARAPHPAADAQSAG